MTSPTTDRRQGLVGNTAVKVAVDCATTAPITLSGEQVIDGFQTASSRVLVWNQADPVQNGIYDTDTGNWTRSLDANGAYDLTQGSMVYVNNGLSQGNTYFNLSTVKPQVGSSGLVWRLALLAVASVISFIQAGIGAVTQTVQDRLRQQINVKDFGAIGDGVVDDVGAYERAVVYAQSLLISRFLGGVTIYFPRGTYYFSRAPMSITKSSITVAGESTSSSTIYGGLACTWDILIFDGSALSCYNVGVRNLRIYTPGNCTAGAHIRATRCINSNFIDLQLVGWFDAVVLDGCAKTHLDDIVYSQENRTAGTTPRYARDFKATNFWCSDIHITGNNVAPDMVNAPTPITTSVRGCDGIYVDNDHGFGAWLFQPTTSAVFPLGPNCATVFWTDCYFDTSVDNNLKWTGTSPSYRNFHFTACYARDSGGNALEFNAVSPISDVTWTGGKIDSSRLFGVIGLSRVTGVKFSSMVFNNNNTDNLANTGDVSWISGDISLANCTLKSGGLAGTAITLGTSAANCSFMGNNLIDSNCAVLVHDVGTANKFSRNPGYVTKNSGTVVLTSGTTALVIPHGLGLAPALAHLQPFALVSSSPQGVTYFALTNPTSASFTATPSSAPPGPSTWRWGVDMEVG